MARYQYEYPHPAVTVDVAALTQSVGQLRILLIRRGQEPFRGAWALPGGFIDIDEELDDAARREFFEETGLEAGTIEQMHTFGTVGRDPRERTISVVFLCYFDTAASAVAGDDAAEAAWFAADALPELAFDHEAVVGMALARARAHFSRGDARP